MKQKTFDKYTQSGPIMNGGVMARSDAAVRYRTILRVVMVCLVLFRLPLAMLT